MINITKRWLTAICIVTIGSISVPWGAFADPPKQAAVRATETPRAAIPAGIGKSQIVLRSTVMKIDRDTIDALGLDFKTTSGVVLGESDHGSQQVVIANQREAKLFADALRASGAAKRLAEPVIITQDGRLANFVSGGEIPLPAPTATGKVSHDHQRVGTSIDFLPQKLPNGKLRLEIRAEQTELDPSNNVQVNGTTVPGFNSQRVDTAVELQSGQCVMLHHDQLLVMVTPEFVSTPSAIRPLPQPPQPLAARRAAPHGPAIITMTAMIYAFDAQKMADSDLNLQQTLTGPASLAKTFVAATEGTSARAIVSVVSPRTVADLTRQLKETQGVRLLSRPQVRTANGQSARVQVGRRVPLKATADVEQASGEFQEIGVTLDIVPIIQGDLLHLEARAEHATLQNTSAAPGGESPVESVSLAGTADLYPGESLVVCQHDNHGQQLLAFITPAGLLSGPSLPSPAPVDSASVQQTQRKYHAAIQTLDKLRATYGAQHPQLLQQQRQVEALSRQAADEAARVEHTLEDEKARARSIHEFHATVDDLFPEAKVQLRALPNGVLLRGTVSRTQDANVLLRVAENFFPDVVSDLDVRSSYEEEMAAGESDLQPLRAALDELFPTVDVTIYPLRNSIVLKGNADPAIVPRIIRVAEEFFPAVINHLSEHRAMQETSRTAPIEVTESSPPSRHSTDQLRRELQDLREDVRMLRQDVGRLLDLLRESVQEQPKGDAPDAEAQSDFGNRDARAMMWDLIGIRAESTTIEEGRFRRGLRISEVRTNSPAADVKLRQGDILIGLNNWETTAVANVKFALDHAEATKSEKMKFYLLRGGRSLFGSLTFRTWSQEPADLSQGDVDAPATPNPTTDLKPGDRLQLESRTDHELNRTLTVLADGTVTMPLLGQIPAADRTLREFKHELTDRLAKFYKNPAITVSYWGTSSPTQ